MKAAELLARNPKPSRDEIVAHMDGNICRCGTYNRIIAAIQRASIPAASRRGIAQLRTVRRVRFT